MKPLGKIAVFLSGRGSNFEAIYHFSQTLTANFKIAVVISDKKNAKGLKTAHKFNLDAHHVSLRKALSKQEYEKHIIKILEPYDIDLICLAGYMKIVGQELLRAFPAKIINIHPALLPSFPGLNAQKQAFDYGVKISGCTVHFVDSGVDTGPIILQQPVEILENDSEATLSQRILEQEHQLYSRAIQLYFKCRLKMDGRKVIIENR